LDDDGSGSDGVVGSVDSVRDGRVGNTVRGRRVQSWCGRSDGLSDGEHAYRAILGV